MAPLQTTKNGETFRWTLTCRWVERRVERTQNSLQPQTYIFSFLSFCHPLLLNFFAALVQNPYFTLPLPPRLWWDVPFRHLRVYSVRNHEKSIWGDPGLTTNYKYPQMGMNALKKERGIQMLNNEDTHHTEQSSYYKHGSLSTREERYERKKDTEPSPDPDPSWPDAQLSSLRTIPPTPPPSSAFSTLFISLYLYFFHLLALLLLPVVVSVCYCYCFVSLPCSHTCIDHLLFVVYCLMDGWTYGWLQQRRIRMRGMVKVRGSIRYASDTSMALFFCIPPTHTWASLPSPIFPSKVYVVLVQRIRKLLRGVEVELIKKKRTKEIKKVIVTPLAQSTCSKINNVCGRCGNKVPV